MHFPFLVASLLPLGRGCVIWFLPTGSEGYVLLVEKWVSWFLSTGVEGGLFGCSPLGRGLCSSHGEVDFMVTPYWGIGWVSWLLSTGGEGLGYSLLGRGGCFGYSSLEEWQVIWLLLAGGEDGLCSSHWGAGFQGNFPLEVRVGHLVTPHWVRGFCSSHWGSGVHGYSSLAERVGGLVYSPLGERGYVLLAGEVGFMVTPLRGRGWVACLIPAGGKSGLHGYYLLGERAN